MAKNIEVIVYRTPTCPYCHDAKEFLKSIKVKYKDINIREDEKAAKKMVEKSGQSGIPVIEIGDDIIVGFDKEEIEKSLKKHKII